MSELEVALKTQGKIHQLGAPGAGLAAQTSMEHERSVSPVLGTAGAGGLKRVEPS
jgi:hypothetical protein